MVRRIWTFLAFIMVAAGAGGAAPVQPVQPRIVAVGDLHGDYDVWLDIARAAGLIDRTNHWAGGKTMFVQLGDVPDRGPDSLKIIRHLMQLQKEAPKAGGKVIALVGNHEAMNMTGDLRYVVAGEYAAFVDAQSAARRDKVFTANVTAIARQYRQTDPTLTDAAVRARWMQETPLGWVEHMLAWKPSGEVGRWVERNPAIASIRGNLFVHGGISSEYSRLPVAEINKRVATALASGDGAPTSIVNDQLGPLWYRGLVAREPGEVRPPVDQELTTVLNAYGARRIVVAHTPQLSGIGVLQGGRLIRIDTGNSRYYGGTPSYLEIIGDRVVPHAVARSAK